MDINSTIDIVINATPSIPPMPTIKDKTKVDVRYMLIVPYVDAHVHWDAQRGELVMMLRSQC